MATFDPFNLLGEEQDKEEEQQLYQATDPDDPFGLLSSSSDEAAYEEDDREYSPFRGEPDPADEEIGRGEDLFNRLVGSAATTATDTGIAVAAQDVAAQRQAGEAEDVAGVMGFRGVPAMGGTFDALNRQVVEESLGMSEEEKANVIERAQEIEAKDVYDHPAAAASEAVRDWAEDNFPTNPEYNDELMSHFASGAGSLVTFLAASAISPALTTVMGAGVNATSQFEDALRNGASFEDALESAGIGGAVGTTEAIPLSFMFNRLNKATGNKFSQAVTSRIQDKLAKIPPRAQTGAGVVSEGLMGAVEEAIQETFVSFANNVSAADIVGYDEERDWLENLETDAQVGGGLGFLVNTAMAAVGAGKASRQTRRIERELLGDFLGGSAELEAREALDPQRAQMYVPPKAEPDQRPLPSVDIEQELKTGDLTEEIASIDSDPRQDAARSAVADIVETDDFGTAELGESAPESRSPIADAVTTMTTPANEPITIEADIPTTDTQMSIEELGTEVDLSVEGQERPALTGRIEDGTTVVEQSFLDEGLRGQGLGTAMYHEFIRDQQSKGRQVQTGDTVTQAALRVWESLRDRGFPVEIAQNLESITDANGTTAYDTPDGRPVARTIGDFGRAEQRRVQPTQGFALQDPNAPLEQHVMAEIAPDMDRMERGQDITRVLANGTEVTANRTADGFTWAVTGEPTTAANSGRIQLEVVEDTGPVEEGPIEDQPLPPEEPPAPPTGPIGGDGGGIFRNVPQAAASPIDNLADVAEMETINLEDSPITIEFTPSRTDPNKQVATVTLENGSRRSVTSEDVKNMAIGRRHSLSKDSWGQWLRKRLNVYGRKNKLAAQLVEYIGETKRTAHAAQRIIATNTSQIEQAWRKKHGVRMREASRPQLRAINEYLQGNLTREEVMTRTEMNESFMDSLDQIRTNVDVVSRVLLKENMLPSELRAVVEENLGSYMRVQYAMKDISAKIEDGQNLLDRIPSVLQNNVAKALQDAYLDPLRGADVGDMSRGSLTRMARLYGVTEFLEPTESSYIDPETGELVKPSAIEVIKGTDIALQSAPKADLIIALQETLTPERVIPEDVMLSFLKAGGESAQTPGGRDKAIERKRMLARTAQQLREEGYSPEEIAFNQSVREMLGEIMDPITQVQQTVNAMMNTVASTRMINYIAQLEAIGAASTEGPRSETGATVPLVDKGSNWGDVIITDPRTGRTKFASSLMVRPELRDVFERLIIPNFYSGGLMSAYRAVQATTKVNLTALNISSHPRNIRSAAEIAAWRGYVTNMSPKRVMQAVNVAARLGARDSQFGFKGEKKDQQDQAAAYLTRLGLFHDGIRVGLIKELLQRQAQSDNPLDAFGAETYITIQGETLSEALERQTVPGKTKMRAFMKENGLNVSPNTLDGVQKAMLDGPLSMFRLEDEAFKVFAWFQERANIAEMMDRPDLVQVMDGDVRGTDEQKAAIRKIDKMAAQRIRNIFPTYSKVPEIVKDASANMLAFPFPSFNAEMIRNSYFDMKDMIDMARYAAGVEGPRYDGFYKGMNRNKVRKRLLEKALSWQAMGAWTAAQITSIGLAGAIGIGAEPEEDNPMIADAKALVKKFQDDPDYQLKLGESYDVLDPYFRAFQPDWGKHNLYKIAAFKPGEELVLIDMNFTQPFAQIGSLGVNVTAGIQSLFQGDYEEAARLTRDGVMRLAGEYINYEPLTKATLEALYDGETSYGQKLEDWDDKAQHIMKVAFPYSQVAKSVGRLTADEGDPHAQSLGNFLIGERPITMDLNKRYVQAMWPHVLEIGSRTAEIKDAIQAFADGEIDEADFRAEYMRKEGYRADAARKLAFIDTSGDVLGMSNRQRKQLVRSSTLRGSNKMSVEDLRTGKFKPVQYRIGDIYKKAEKPNIEKNQRIREAFSIMREIQDEMDWR